MVGGKGKIWVGFSGWARMGLPRNIRSTVHPGNGFLPVTFCIYYFRILMLTQSMVDNSKTPCDFLRSWRVTLILMEVVKCFSLRDLKKPPF
jgi:hypothetical protein